jgi:hypothetical protein
MKANAQHRFGRGALLALTALTLSGCVTANTLEQAQTWTEYRNPQSRWPPPDPKLHLSQAAQLVRLEQEGVIRLADCKDRAALETELTRLEAQGTIQRIEYKGQPAYYALVPFTALADVALTPVYIVYVAVHLK